MKSHDTTKLPQDGRDRAIFAVVHHFRTAFQHMRHDNFLTAPLNHLAKGEARDQLFMPTMPQDETLEVTKAVSGGEHGVTRWYTCSRGHKYGIGNCGQPVGRGQCPDCGEPIGAGRANYAFPDGRNAQPVETCHK